MYSNIRKTIVAILSICLLGQNALFASSDKERSQTLAQYQQRAKQDIQRSPWISKEGVALLGLGGVAVGSLLVQHIRHQKHIKSLTSSYENALYSAGVLRRKQQDIFRTERRYKNEEIRFLKEENRKLQEQAGAAEKRAKQWQGKYRDIAKTDRGWQQARIRELENQIAVLNRQLQEANAKTAGKSHTIRNIHQRMVELKRELHQLQNRFANKKLHYSIWASYPLEWDKELAVYEKLFDKTATEAERQALRAKLAQEPWLLAAPEAQRKQFLHIIDTGMGCSLHGGKVSASSSMRYLTNIFMTKNLPLLERLIAISRHVFHSKNLLAITAVVTLGMSAHEVKAQKMADRINTNFNLFLNATPQQLAAMEKDEEVRNVCIQGAEALHEMAQMSRNEFAFLNLAAPLTPAQIPGSRGSIHLAR